MGADTVSLESQYEESTWEHGRLYQKFAVEKSIYWVPIDEEEEERQNIEDDVLNGVFNNKLFFSDPPHNPNKVLDLGYGQAHWAITVAETYPDCEVTAIDIRPLDLPVYPPNLSLECDNLNNILTDVYPQDSFDIIQSRLVGPGIHKNRWPSYLAELRQLLAPTGTLQACEYYFNIQSHAGLLTPDSALTRWGTLYRRAMERLQRDPRMGNHLLPLCRSAGFAPLQVKYYELPIGSWPSDERQRQIGARMLENMDLMLESFGLWGLVKVLEMTVEEVKKLADDCRLEFKREEIKPYLPCSVVWGGKGLEGSAAGSASADAGLDSATTSGDETA
ncbi:hypothetical protein FH972_025991 [Carpinus fangiana]|uniref:Methyltransferase domain-containing protein n=1 Tax=Carpinus fangiana TaxID=176857 RepID=A0A5N6L2V7_9ROSI|nr:hypothetical protein FH972_025991 [Carpinus fangiana]